MALKFIYARGGLNTSETLLTLLQNHPQGLTMSELITALKRPVSMLLICIKELMKRKQVKAQLINDRFVYFSSHQ